MAHHGYIPLAGYLASCIKTPSILEIGIDRGITTFGMLHRLSSLNRPFSYVAVDILVRPEVHETVKYMGLDFKKNYVALVEKNSLEFLPELIDKKSCFDIIFLDGDHNYYTVKKELDLLKHLVHDDSVIIADDYHGRWSDTDGFYCEYKDHLNNKKATPLDIAKSGEKQGVNQAIDEFIENNDMFRIKTLMPGEPVVIFNKTNEFMTNLSEVEK